MKKKLPAQRISNVCARLKIPVSDDFIYIDTDAQTLIYSKNSAVTSYAISTSKFGTGNRNGSYMTPLGLHRIEDKIGDFASARTVFRSRENTGVIWHEGMDGENQILTRILRLRGLEPEINAGEGIDSYERYIYIHGTNREDLIGTPMSHGCICMKNDDIIELFNIVDTGTLVYIGHTPRTLLIDNTQCDTIHFTGIFGSGMSAIAQYLADTGIGVTGSDRLFDTEDTAKIKRCLQTCGCAIFLQDGSGINENTSALCVSTAIEESNPDIIAARNRNIPILHRSDVLATLVKNSKSIAVAGTSGKSTVTAMIFELLTACGKSPSLISGAALRSLEEKGTLGNAYRGKSDLLVIEADESDGTLVKYEPHASVILNISKDHKPEEEVLIMFARLIKQSQWSAVCADEPKLCGLIEGAVISDIHNNIYDNVSTVSTVPTTFGFGDNAHFKGIMTKSEALSSTITVDKTDYTLPIPGEYNASNLLAALCVCTHLGCNSVQLAYAAAKYKGVDRRFTIHRTASGITVVDDFAHNPEKIRAAVNAAKKLSDRLIVVYQPHGFGPTRFLKNEYAKTFREILRAKDTLCLLPIYYAGGTAVKDITSQNIIELTGTVPFIAIAVAGKDEAIDIIKKHAHNDSCIILMGARDPSLSPFAKRIVECFG